MVEDTFHAAHHLPFHKGKCSNVHGHTWKVRMTVKCEEVDQNGICIDFKRLKDDLHYELERLDHQDLNQVLPSVVPTAENIAKYLFKMLKAASPTGVKLTYITVYESETSGVSYYEPKNKRINNTKRAEGVKISDVKINNILLNRGFNI